MQIESTASNFMIFNHPLTSNQNITEQQQLHYFNKHWQVVLTSIKFFILSKAQINLVAFRKSLDLITLHSQRSIVKAHLFDLWHQIFSQILEDIEKSQKINNPLISLLDYYKTIESRFKIIFDLVKSSLNKGQKDKTINRMDENNKLYTKVKKTAEMQAFQILCKLILESQHRKKYENQMLLLIDAFRNSNYSDQNIVSEQICKGQVILDLNIVKKIGLFTHLEEQFYHSSKDFFVQLSKQIPKDSRDFLFIVDEFLKRQIELNNIFQPQENTVTYIEKVLIKQYYESVMLQTILRQSIQGFSSTISQQRAKSKGQLQILWKFTLRIGQESLKKLYNKLKSLMKQTKKFIKEGKINKDKIFKVLEYRQNLIDIVQKCFNKNRKITNLVYNTFEEVLYEQQQDFLLISIKNILQQQILNQTQKSMEIQVENEQTDIQNCKQFKLFRIAPSKQNFIKQFEVRFCRWILAKGFDLTNLSLQYRLVQQMKKQVGLNLMKKADRMMNDVWRDNQMHYHTKTMKSGANIKCLLLSNQWPTFISLVFNVPDQLYEMSVQFEAQFKKSPQNSQRDLRWVDEMSSVVLNIGGVTSVFSQLEAAILLLLGKSLRPLKKDQIQASLHLCLMGKQSQSTSPEEIISSVLQILLKNNIITLNQRSDTYDLNDQNTVSYKYIKSGQQKGVETIKKNNPVRNDSILIEAAIVKILKKRKHMQRSDISKFIQESVKNFKPSFEQVTKAFENLESRQFIEINRNKGIVSYLE